MKFAFIFPGQGSQSVGMMQGLQGIPVVRRAFQEASDTLRQDFWQMVTEAGEEINAELNLTTNTQPLMLAAGVAVWRAWLEQGGTQPALMAGHSLGEYTALVAAGAIEFKDALPLVRYRAEVMQDAVAEGVGAMAAILGLDDDAVREACVEAAHGEVLEAVNFNSPGQVVIAGHKTAVERGMEVAKAKGAKRVLILPVSVPSHCALMKPAAEKLQSYLANVTVRASSMPVLHNTDVAAYTEPPQIKDALVRQLYSPVRWVETIRAMTEQGITALAECGPGKILTGLNKRIAGDMPCLALIDTATLHEANTLFNQ